MQKNGLVCVYCFRALTAQKINIKAKLTLAQDQCVALASCVLDLFFNYDTIIFVDMWYGQRMTRHSR